MLHPKLSTTYDSINDESDRQELIELYSITCVVDACAGVFNVYLEENLCFRILKWAG